MNIPEWLPRFLMRAGAVLLYVGLGYLLIRVFIPFAWRWGTGAL